MLYEPNGNKPPPAKHHPVSLEALAAWLETQDPGAHYDYGNIHACLLTRYFKNAGYWRVICGPDSFNYAPAFFLPPFFWKRIPPAMNEVASEGPWSYGAALQRARDLIAA